MSNINQLSNYYLRFRYFCDDELHTNWLQHLIFSNNFLAIETTMHNNNNNNINKKRYQSLLRNEKKLRRNLPSKSLLFLSEIPRTHPKQRAATKRGHPATIPFLQVLSLFSSTPVSPSHCSLIGHEIRTKIGLVGGTWIQLHKSRLLVR